MKSDAHEALYTAAEASFYALSKKAGGIRFSRNGIPVEDRQVNMVLLVSAI